MKKYVSLYCCNNLEYKVDDFDESTEEVISTSNDVFLVMKLSDTVFIDKQFIFDKEVLNESEKNNIDRLVLVDKQWGFSKV